MTAHERERAPAALAVDATLAAQLIALRQTYIQTARDHAAVMHQLWATRALVTRALHRLHRHAHALAGTAIMLGFAGVGAAAEAVQAAIERAGIESDTHDWVLVAAVTAALVQVEQAVSTMEAAPITWFGLGSASKEGEALMQAMNALALAGRSIIIVEDSGDVHYQLQLGLELAGAESALCCATLRQARAVLAPDLPAPEVVLIDHYLGRRTGAELATWMQQQPHLQQTWRVSYSEAPAEVIQRSAGADAYHLIWRKRDLPELIAALAELCTTLPAAVSAKEEC